MKGKRNQFFSVYLDKDKGKDPCELDVLDSIGNELDRNESFLKEPPLVLPVHADTYPYKV